MRAGPDETDKNGKQVSRKGTKPIANDTINPPGDGTGRKASGKDADISGMNRIDELLIKAVECGSSDLHLTVAAPPMVRTNGQLQPLKGCEPLTADDTREIAMCMLPPEQDSQLEQAGQVDFSYVVPQIGRFRVNLYKQRRSYCAAIRVLVQQMPTIESLGLPPALRELSLRRQGLILVTGPTGCGKSTTLAAMVNCINRNRCCHVLTIEDPIEYLHRHGKSIINQREIGDDTRSFADGLRAAMREDPDVVLVGEMRDLDTIATAISAAETGHLVLSALRTIGAAQTVSRLVDMFPPFQQQQIRVQLSAVLQAVITQRLLPNALCDGRVPAVELLLGTDAVRRMIRENHCGQIAAEMQTGIGQGMLPMDYSLAKLVQENRITRRQALAHCTDRETLERYLAAGT